MQSLLLKSLIVSSFILSLHGMMEELQNPMMVIPSGNAISHEMMATITKIMSVRAQHQNAPSHELVHAVLQNVLELDSFTPAQKEQLVVAGHLLKYELLVQLGSSLTLVAADGKSFYAPLSVALQSQTIKTIIEASLSQEKHAEKIHFKNMDSKQLGNIAEIMWTIFDHKSLKGKALLDTFKPLPVDDAFALLDTADLLEFNPALHLAARTIAAAALKDSAVAQKINTLRTKPLSSNEKEQFNAKFLEVIKFYFLLGKTNEFIVQYNLPAKFSIQDYLDYQPEKLKQRIYKDEFNNELSSGDHGTALHLNSLDGLENLPDAQNMKGIDLSHDTIVSIPQDIFLRFRNLLWLKLGGNFQQLAPHTFVGLTNLRKLVINNLSLESIAPQTFEGLNQLIELDFNEFVYANPKAKLTLAPGIFKELHNLKTLQLSNNGIDEIPRQVFEGLGNLASLHFGDCTIQEIPNDAFAGLHNLQSLNLGHNKITLIAPHAFDNLANVSRLWLHDNALKKVDALVFKNLTKLETLDLSGNSLSSENIAEIRKMLPHIRIILVSDIILN